MSYSSILIHGYKDREWYVDDILIPRLEKLNDKRTPVFIRSYIDETGQGNQNAFIESINVEHNEMNINNNTWHMQDDVWPSKNFFKVLKMYDDVPGIICGFGTRPSCRGKNPGWTTSAGMYTSFQCIRIPNRMILEFREYLKKRENLYDKWDDAHFEDFLKRYYPYYPVLNLSPSIVEHVDWLIGGSILNADRTYLPTAIEFDDVASLFELKRLLNKQEDEK